MDKNAESLHKVEEEEHRRYHRRLSYTAVVIIIVLFGSATFYHYVEGWRYLDSVYFSAYTMTTVGYGDITPHTDAGKIFTIVFMFTGVGIALYGISLLASHFVEMREEFWLQALNTKQISKHTTVVRGVLRKILHYDTDNMIKGQTQTKKKKK